MGAEGGYMMIRGTGMWEVPAHQHVPKLPLPKASPRSPSKPSPRINPVKPPPSILNNPRKVAAELSVLMLKLEANFTTETDGSSRWRCTVREASLLEDWLNNMLHRPGSQRNDSENKGLYEYGLSRLQLGFLGLSETQVDRAYRMLYVYSVGCHELIKELCLHSLEKSLLVGCFWRAFIRLCEEHSKIELQAEIAELMEEKQNAVDELRLTRGCLNEALNGLAMKRLLSNNNDGEDTAFEMPTSLSDGNVVADQVNESQRQSKVDSKLQVLVQKYDNLNEEMKQLQEKLDDTTRLLRVEQAAHNASAYKERERTAEVAYLEEKVVQLQANLDKERREVVSLREYSTKLEKNVEDTEKKTSAITWKFVQYEQEFPVLQEEAAELRKSVEKLMQENEKYLKDYTAIKDAHNFQQATMVKLSRKVEVYENAVRDLKEEANERTRQCQEKAKEASLTGEEVEAWIKGHEDLLSQQFVLLSQIDQLKRFWKKEKDERSKERMSMEAKIRVQEENLRALTIGIASLTPRRTGTKRKSLVADVNIETEQMRAERRLSRRLSRKFSRRATEGVLGFKGISELSKRGLEQVSEEPTTSISSEEISELQLQDSDEEWDDLCSELSTQRAEIEKLEGSVKEERDRRMWMERHVEDTVKELERLVFEADQTNLRVVNLALEKKNKEKNLQFAEDQIRKLDRQLADFDTILECRNREIESLKESVTREITKQVECVAKCKKVLGVGSKGLQEKMVREIEVVGSKVVGMMSKMMELRSKVTKAGSDMKKWKSNTNIIDNENAVMTVELKSLKGNLENLSRENISLSLKLKQEEEGRAGFEDELKQVKNEVNELKMEKSVVENQAENFVKEKMQSEIEKEKMFRKMIAFENELKLMKSEKEKEDAIRGILQADVDSLRLELETLKQATPHSSSSSAVASAVV